MQNMWEMLNRLINPKPREQDNAQRYKSLKEWEECLLGKAVDIMAASTLNDCVVFTDQFSGYTTITFPKYNLSINKNHWRFQGKSCASTTFYVSMGKPGKQAVVTCGCGDKHFKDIDRAFHNMLYDKKINFVRRALAEANHDF